MANKLLKPKRGRVENLPKLAVEDGSLILLMIPNLPLVLFQLMLEKLDMNYLQQQQKKQMILMHLVAVVFKILLTRLIMQQAMELLLLAQTLLLIIK